MHDQRWAFDQKLAIREYSEIKLQWNSQPDPVVSRRNKNTKMRERERDYYQTTTTTQRFAFCTIRFHATPKISTCIFDFPVTRSKNHLHDFSTVPCGPWQQCDSGVPGPENVLFDTKRGTFPSVKPSPRYGCLFCLYQFSLGEPHPLVSSPWLFSGVCLTFVCFASS